MPRRKNPILDPLASEHVGDGGSPNLYFCSDPDTGECVLVTSDREAAINYARYNRTDLEDRQFGVMLERGRA